MKTDIRISSLLIGAWLLSALSGCGRSPADYLSRAEKQMQEGKSTEAILSYRRALQAQPDLGAAHKGLGLAYLKEGELGTAFGSLSRASELLPNDEEVLRSLSELALGAYLVDSRRPESLRTRALDLADKMEALAPRSSEPWRLRGLIAGADGKAAEALDFFRRATSLRTSPDPTLKLMEIQALSDSGKASEAEQAGRQLIQANPTFGPGYDWLLGRYLSANRVREGEELLRQKVEANPGNVAFGLQLANFYRFSGKPNEMQASVDRAMQQKSASSLVEAADFYLKLGDAGKAIEYLEQAVRADPASAAAARKRLAQILGAQGKFSDALARIAEVRKADKDDVDAVRIEADLRLVSGATGDLELAERIYQELAIRSPADVAARYGLARVAMARGDEKGARQELERAIGLNARHMPSVVALAELDRRAGKWRELVLLADAVLALDPRSVYAKQLRAEGLIAMKRGAEARQLMNPLLADPLNAREATLLIARSHQVERNYAAAEGLLRKLYDPSEADQRPLEALSDLLVAQGKRGEVENLWRLAFARRPGSRGVERGLAKALYLVGKPKESIAHLKALVASEPNDVESAVLLGLGLYAVGEKQEAEVWFRKAAELPGADKSVIDGTIAYLLQFNEDDPAAEVYYRRILAREPNNDIALNNLAYHLARRGKDVKEADSFARRAAALRPENIYYLDTVGFVTLQLGNAKDAERQFAGLIKRSPSEPYFRYHRGLALTKLDRRAEALEELRAALQRSSTGEFRDRIQRAISDIE